LTIVQEAFIFDAIYGQWHGGEKDWDSDEDGQYPVVMPLSTSVRDDLKQMFNRVQTGDIPLDPQEHVVTLDNPKYGPPIKVLRPTRDMPDINYEQTLWYQLVGDIDEERQELIEENKDLRKEIGRLEKKVERLQEAEEEKEKRESSGSTSPKVPCPMCTEAFTEETWRNNDGACPSCESRHHRFAGGDAL